MLVDKQEKQLKLKDKKERKKEKIVMRRGRMSNVRKINRTERSHKPITAPVVKAPVRVPKTIKNPNLIYPGQVLRIPALTAKQKEEYAKKHNTWKKYRVYRKKRIMKKEVKEVKKEEKKEEKK